MFDFLFIQMLNRKIRRNNNKQSNLFFEKREKERQTNLKCVYIKAIFFKNIYLRYLNDFKVNYD